MATLEGGGGDRVKQAMECRINCCMMKFLEIKEFVSLPPD